MSKSYIVSKAFRATVSREDKTPKTVTFDGHTFDCWKVQLEGEGDKGWININKKPGNEISPGDELYGDVNAVKGKFGAFYNFKSASRPLGQVPGKKNGSDDSIGEKIDYMIAMLESLTCGDDDAVNTVQKTIPGSKPIDLDELDI